MCNHFAGRGAAPRAQLGKHSEAELVIIAPARSDATICEMVI
jgi:hypothetical protein